MPRDAHSFTSEPSHSVRRDLPTQHAGEQAWSGYEAYRAGVVGLGLALGLEEGVEGVRVVQLVQDLGLLAGNGEVARGQDLDGAEGLGRGQAEPGAEHGVGAVRVQVARADLEDEAAQGGGVQLLIKLVVHAKGRG